MFLVMYRVRDFCMKNELLWQVHRWMYGRLRVCLFLQSDPSYVSRYLALISEIGRWPRDLMSHHVCMSYLLLVPIQRASYE